MNELRLHVRPALRDAPLLLAFGGWNDAGDAATLAVRYVEEAIRAVPLAEIDCEEFLDFTRGAADGETRRRTSARDRLAERDASATARWTDRASS